MVCNFSLPSFGEQNAGSVVTASADPFYSYQSGPVYVAKDIVADF